MARESGGEWVKAGVAQGVRLWFLLLWFWPGFAGNFRRLPFGPWLPHPALLLAEYFAAGVIFGIKHVRALITHSRHVLVGLLA